MSEAPKVRNGSNAQPNMRLDRSDEGNRLGSRGGVLIPAGQRRASQLPTFLFLSLSIDRSSSLALSSAHASSPSPLLEKAGRLFVAREGWATCRCFATCSLPRSAQTPGRACIIIIIMNILIITLTCNFVPGMV